MKHILIFLILGAFCAPSFGQFEHLKTAPKAKDCGCLVKTVLKLTKEKQTEGLATIYKDVIILSFGNTTKQLNQVEGMFYSDEKDTIYKLSTVNKGYYLKLGSSEYFILN